MKLLTWIIIIFLFLTCFALAEPLNSITFNSSSDWENLSRVEKEASSETGSIHLLKSQNQQASNSFDGILDANSNKIAQAHGALFFSEGKENPEVWDLLSITANGKFTFYKNKDGGDSLTWELIEDKSYTAHSGFNGYGTGILGFFDDDEKIDYFGISEGNRTNGKAVFVSDVLDKGSVSVTSVSKDSGAFVNKAGENVNGTCGWTSTGMGLYDMDDDDDMDVVYSAHGSIFVIRNNEGKFIEDNTLDSYALFDEPLLKNSGSAGAAVCDVHDFNGDGIPDIVAAHTDRKGLYIYFGKEPNDSDFPEYDIEEKMELIDSEGKLGDGLTGTLMTGIESSNVISLLKTDEKGNIYIGSDGHRQNANNGGNIMYFELKSKNGNPIFEAETLVDGKNKDFDHGSLGKFYTDGREQLVIADGNDQGQFFVTKTVYSELYEPEGSILTQPVTKLLGMSTDEIKNFFIKSLTVDITKLPYNDLTKRGFKDNDELYIKVIPADRLDKINADYESLFQEENKLTGTSTTTTLERPVPYPAILIGIKVNDDNRTNNFDDGNGNNNGKGYSVYPLVIDSLTITVNEFAKPSLYITNYYWTNNK